jgi:hypothetical protein
MQLKTFPLPTTRKPREAEFPIAPLAPRRRARFHLIIVIVLQRTYGEMTLAAAKKKGEDRVLPWDF